MKRDVFSVRVPTLLSRLVNGLVSLTWVWLAAQFVRSPNILGRQAPLPFTIWLVLALLVLFLLLFFDVRRALRAAGQPYRFLIWGDALLWLSFLLGVAYWQVNALATPWFGMLVCLLVASSFGLKALPVRPPEPEERKES